MADQRNAIEDHVTCSICMDLYDEPIALPCMHSFCRRCLFGIYSSSLVIKCPDCRKDTRLGKGGVDSLPRNFQLGSIVESYKKEHQSYVPKLPFCAEHRIPCQLLCETCKQSICTTCLITTQKHSRHSITVSVERTSSNVDGAAVCRQHTRDNGFYCTNCRELACLECIVATHREHALEPMDLVYKEIVGDLDETVSDLDSRQRLLKATQKSCRTMAQKIQIDSQRKHQEVTVYVSRLREAFDKKESLLKREIESREKTAVERYLSKAEQAAKKELRVGDVINDVKRLLTEDKHNVLKSHRKTSESVRAMLESEELDGMPKVRGLDGVSLVTCSLDEQLTNIQWQWPEEPTKPARKAPPIPAQRKSKGTVKADKPRAPSLNPGCPVKRGPAWKDGLRDGGPGHYGAIVQTTVDPAVYLISGNGVNGEFIFFQDGFDDVFIVLEIIPITPGDWLRMGCGSSHVGHRRLNATEDTKNPPKFNDANGKGFGEQENHRKSGNQHQAYIGSEKYHQRQETQSTYYSTTDSECLEIKVQ